VLDRLLGWLWLDFIHSSLKFRVSFFPPPSLCFFVSVLFIITSSHSRSLSQRTTVVYIYRNKSSSKTRDIKKRKT
jgi:hypothetical protein